MNKKVVVSGYQRGRTDHVSDMLRAASKSKLRITIHDYALQYSERMGLTWHIDPSALKSAIVQAQQKLRMSRDELVATTGEVIVKAVEAGEFNRLLGSKLFPTAPANGKARTGKYPCWCGDTETLPNRKPTPDGMGIQEIQNLIRFAEGAGDNAFKNSQYVRDLAKMSKNRRKRDIIQLISQYEKMIDKEMEITQLKEINEQLITQLEDYSQKILLIENLTEKIDFEKLAQEFGKPVAA
jgi:hypothetical protein